MPPVRGFQAQAAIAIETVVNAEVATTRKLRYISDSIDKNFAPIENEMLGGSASMGPSDQGLATVTGDLVLDWDFTLLDLMFSRFFGTLTAGAYSLDDVIDDKSFTLALGKVVDEHVFTGCKATQLVLSGAPGQPMRATWTLFPQDRVLGSVLNTQAVLDAIADPTLGRVLFHHCAGAVLIGDQADILAAGDALKINQWQLTINRAMSQFHANAQTPEQALEDGFQLVELQITTPLYDNNFFITAHGAHTPLQMKTTFTRGANTKIFRIPNMFVTSAPVPIAGPGLVPRTVTFSCKNDLGGSNASADMDFPEALKLYET